MTVEPNSLWIKLPFKSNEAPVVTVIRLTVAVMALGVLKLSRVAIPLTGSPLKSILEEGSSLESFNNPV